MKITSEIAAIMNERFGHDTLIALATVDGDSPAVRTVDAYYEDGCFYTVTYGLSGKMHHRLGAVHCAAAANCHHCIRVKISDCRRSLRRQLHRWIRGYF